MQPINLYIHVPFCNVKCKYCAFYTLPKQNTKFKAYFNALLKEVSLVAPLLKNYSVTTIYIGGGTPSLVNPHWIKELLNRIFEEFSIRSDVEVTMEANPESISEKKLLVYKETQINRLSIGLQAWQNHLLSFLGRTYQTQDFVRRIDFVKQVGFQNFNIDLIFGIPGQTMADWRESLDQVISLQPKHMSCYSLELDNNSFFGVLYKKGKFTPANETLDRAMYRETKKVLKANEFTQYEISNFSQKGFESRHNLQFWQGNLYLGLGAGAHSFFEGVHFHNVEHLDTYMQTIDQNKLPTVDHFTLTELEFLKEKLIIGLRLIEGVEIRRFNSNYSVDLESLFNDQLQHLLKHDLIKKTSDRLILTTKGQDLENQVALAFA